MPKWLPKSNPLMREPRLPIGKRSPPDESLSFFDVSEFSGQGDETGRNSEGSTTTNRVTNAFRANCQRSSSMSESIGKKCGRKLVHQASAGDIERFAGGMRGVTGCQKKSSLGNFVMLGVFSQGRKF